MTNDHLGGGSGAMAQSGLHRLMLKLPAHRKRLQELPGSTSWSFFVDLFVAYDEACVALETFRHEDAACIIIKEYEMVCGELEADIVRVLERVIIWPGD